MAQTLDEIIAQLRAEFPEIAEDVNGERVVQSPEDYEATLAAWAANVQAKQTEDDAITAQKDARRQVRLALTLLAADRDQLDSDYADLVNTALPLTATQLRPYLARANRIMKHTSATTMGLITTLVDQRVIEPDPPPAQSR